MFQRMHIGFTLLLCITVAQAYDPFDYYANYDLIIREMRKNKDDSSISETEREKISAEGGSSSIYGEIKFGGVLILLDYLQLTPNDCFCDLGSGLGALSYQAFFMSDCYKVMGIELATERWEKAQSLEREANKIYVSSRKFENDMRKTFDKPSLPKVKKSIEFLNESFLKADLSEPTVFFICATCFSDDCMKTLTDRFASLKDGVRILTLRTLAENKDVHLVKKFYLPMTWSPRTAVYLYVVDRHNKPAMEPDYDPFNRSLEDDESFLPKLSADQESEEIK